MTTKYTLLSAEDSQDWLCDAPRLDIDTMTTDEEIDTLMKDYEISANGDGYSMSPGLRDILIAHRTSLYN